MLTPILTDSRRAADEQGRALTAPGRHDGRVRAVVLRPAAVPVAVVRRADPAQAAGLPRPGRVPRGGDAGHRGRRADRRRVGRQGAQARRRPAGQPHAGHDRARPPVRAAARRRAGDAAPEDAAGRDLRRAHAGPRDQGAARGRPARRTRRSRTPCSSTRSSTRWIRRRAPRSAPGSSSWPRGSRAAGATSTTRSARCRASPPTASDVLQVLDSQEGALQRLVKNTGVTFAALTENEQQLQTLITSSKKVFDATASRNDALAESVRIFPTFLDESKATLARLETFSRDTRPLVQDLRPVAVGPQADARRRSRDGARPRALLPQPGPADRRVQARAAGRARDARGPAAGARRASTRSWASSTRCCSTWRRRSPRSRTSSPTAPPRCPTRRRHRAAASATTCASSGRSAPRARRSTRSACPPTAGRRTSARCTCSGRRPRSYLAGALVGLLEHRRRAPAVTGQPGLLEGRARCEFAEPHPGRLPARRGRRTTSRRNALGRAAGGGGGGEAAEQRIGEPAVAAERQPVGRAVGAERADPGVLAAGHDRAGAVGRGALGDLDAAAADREPVAALGSPSPSTIRSTEPSIPAGGSISPGARRNTAPTLMSSPGRGRAPGPVVAPARERADHRHQLTRALGQLVVDPRRHLAVALAGQQAVGHHPVQSRAQLLGRDPGQDALELDEAPRAGGEVADDQQRPLVADEVERAGVRGPLIVGVTLGGRDGGNSGASGRTLKRPFAEHTRTRGRHGFMSWTFGG